MSMDQRKGKRIINGKKRATPALPEYTLDEAIEAFYVAKQAAGMRPRTLSDYRAHWKYFRGWSSIVMLAELTPTVIRNYINYMTSERVKYVEDEFRKKSASFLSPVTASIRLKTIKTACAFWTEEGLLDFDPARNVKPPRIDKEDIEAFTDDQLRKLLAAVDISTFTGNRDKTLMLLLADSGLRISEALRLTTAHIDVKSRCIHLSGAENKNRKPRIIPVSADIMRLMYELAAENRSYFPTDYIFINNYGSPLKSDHFRKRLRDYGIKAGIHGEVRVSPHTFRHYFCTAYLANGGDVFTLQRIVAHADLETTRKYVTTRNEAMREQHAAVSPITRLGIKRKK